MKLSIVIPTYNRAGLIRRALSSIDAPQGHSIEVIVVDDGDDETEDIVRNFKGTHPKIEWLYMKPQKRIGVNHARNQGARRATGDWVAFLDSDDEYVTGGIDNLLSDLSGISDRFGVAGFMTLREVAGMMEPRGYAVGESWKTYEPSYEDIVMKKDIRGDIHYCIRRDIFARGFGFPEDIQGFESFFFADIAKHGVRFLYINKVVDKRYTEGYEHIGSYAKWPKQYGRYYIKFAEAYFEVLEKYPDSLRSLYRSAGTAYLRAFDPRGFWWLGKYLLMTFSK